MVWTGELLCVASLIEAATARLRAQPTGDAEALALVRRAQGIIKNQSALTVEDSQSTKLVLKALEPERAKFIAALADLEKKASGKK
jgi:hypothetical protein